MCAHQRLRLIGNDPWRSTPKRSAKTGVKHRKTLQPPHRHKHRYTRCMVTGTSTSSQNCTCGTSTDIKNVHNSGHVDDLVQELDNPTSTSNCTRRTSKTKVISQTIQNSRTPQATLTAKRKLSDTKGRRNTPWYPYSCAPQATQTPNRSLPETRGHRNTSHPH